MIYRIITAILLIASVARADFEGFPLATNTNHYSWYTAHEAHAPMTQIVEAYRERMTATGNMTTNWTYVETYTVDAGVLTTNEFLGGAWYTSWQAPNTNGEYRIVYQGDCIWVIPDAVEVIMEDFWYDVLWGGVEYTQTYYMTTNIVVTNTPSDFKFGEFVVDLGGHSYTGHAYATKGLLDMLWDGLSESLSWSTGKWLVPDLATNTVYYSNTNLLNYSIYGLSDPYGTHFEISIGDSIIPPRLTIPYVFNKHEIGEVTGITSNGYGLVSGGSVEYYETPTNLAFDVLLADAHYGITNRTDVSTNDVPDYVDEYGWTRMTNVLPSEAGLNYTWFAMNDDWTNRPVLVSGSTNTNTTAGVLMSLAGTVYTYEIGSTNDVPEATNLVWNKNWFEPVYSYEVTPAYVVTNWVIRTTNMAEELLSVGDTSTNVWHAITNVTGVGSPVSNEYVSLSLVWPRVDHWTTAPYRLYAQDIDRLYYTLSEMKTTLLEQANLRDNVSHRIGNSGHIYGTSYSAEKTSTNAVEFDAGQTGEEIPDWWFNPDRTVITNRPPSLGTVIQMVRGGYKSSSTSYTFNVSLEDIAESSIFGVFLRPYSENSSNIEATDSGLRWSAWYREEFIWQSSSLSLSGLLPQPQNAQHRAIVMMGDYSGRSHLNSNYPDHDPLWSLPGDIYGCSVDVESGWGIGELGDRAGDPPGGLYPMDTALLSEPMSMIHVYVGSYTSATNHSIGSFGTTSGPSQWVTPQVERDDTWYEVQGYSATELMVILEWDFEYK